jgi:hypothetical protein
MSRFSPADLADIEARKFRSPTVDVIRLVLRIPRRDRVAGKCEVSKWGDSIS